MEQTDIPMLRVRIGNQTARAAADPLEPYAFAQRHGFDAFEWFSDRGVGEGFAFEQLGEAQRAELRAAAQAHDMQFSVHAPWTADPWQQGDDAPLRESVRFAADIGADPLVLHMNPDAPARAFLEALAPTVAQARKLNVRLALENTVRMTPTMVNALFTAAQTEPALRTTLGMCFDLGHANLCPDTRHDYLRYLDQLEAHVPIIHVHLHENFGDFDSHLTLFTGPAGDNDAGVRGVLERLARRRFIGCLILEQWPEPPELLVTARDRLRAMLSHAPAAVEPGDAL